MQNAERRMQNNLIPLSLHSQGKVHITNYLDFTQEVNDRIGYCFVKYSAKISLLFSLWYLALLLVHLKTR